MAIAGANLVSLKLSPVHHRRSVQLTGKYCSRQVSTQRSALSTTDDHQALNSTNTTPPPTVSNSKNREFFEKNNKSVTKTVSKALDDSEIEKLSVKDYLDWSKDFIRSDGGPPRWFSPLECGARWENSPLLLFLPALDGVGLGLMMHHQRLGKMFDVWCLHIPVMDRTPFEDLVQLVERTIKSEYSHSPNRPIYLVGESVGGCLALAVAARNPDIDLMLILANPATSFKKSQVQPLLPFMEVIPEQLHAAVPYFLSLVAGNPFKMVMTDVEKGLPLEQTAWELSKRIASLLPSISVLGDILPKQSLLWKLQMLKSASSFANSRLHAVKAEVLILASGRDQLLPSQEEAERLFHVLPTCQIRNFTDSGHNLFMEDGFDLVSIIKGAGFYRRSRNMDYVNDFMLPTQSEFRKVYESFRFIDVTTSPVMLSTLENGKIVKDLAGIPCEGPVIYVGYHMLLGLELGPFVSRFLMEKDILLRGIAHPLMFGKNWERSLLDPSSFDMFRIMGGVPVSGTNLYKLLSRKSHVLLYPGGVREALHRKGEEYKLFWPLQSEFVRMAARFGAKIVPFGVIGEDDVLDVVLDYEDFQKIPYVKAQIEELNNGRVRRLRHSLFAHEDPAECCILMCPFTPSWIAGLTLNTVQSFADRSKANGEVAEEDLHFPGVFPKIPGRFYFLFGKPIETEGMEEELTDREKANEFYLHVKSEVVRNMAYLKEKREKDPYRSLLSRLAYQASNGFTSAVPTFEL